MKLIKIGLVFLLSFFFFNACDKKDSGTNPIDSSKDDLTALLPYEIGNVYRFNVDTLNATTNKYENSGTRKTGVKNKTKVDDYYNIVCEETYLTNGFSQNYNTKFKVSKDEISYYADTVAIKDLIPDSLKSQFSLEVSNMFNLLNKDYTNSNKWDVYKVAVNTLFGNYNVLIIKGNYLGEENVQLSDLNKTVSAKKIEYSLELNIPNPSNFLQSKTKSSKAYAWFTKEYGIIKLEGSALLVNPVSGHLFTPADSVRTLRHTLIAVE